MKITNKMEEALNNHIQEEFFSSYLYLSMAAYFSEQNLNGFAHWMKTQSREEWGHAMKLFDYLLQRNGRVFLKEIQKPLANFKSVENVFDLTLKHEQKVTAQIHKLYELAGKEKDYATQNELQWFIKEQVEEEATVQNIVEKLKIIGAKGGSLLYLDKEFGKRE